jgi:hypothetical protein
MSYVLRFSSFVLIFSLVVLWLSLQIGVSIRKRRRSLQENEREDFGMIMSANPDAARPHYRIHLLHGD